MEVMARPTFTKNPPRFVRARHFVQGAFLLAWLGPFGLRLHYICGPVFHCYACPLATFACPIGVLANFSALAVSPLIALGTLLLVGALVGGLICGWVCPFGLVQDLMDKIPLPKLRLPVWAGYTRYAILVGLVLVIPYLFGESHPLFICRVCPAGALEAGLPLAADAVTRGDSFWTGMSVVKWVVLGVFLTAAVVKYRPWCTLFCPLGAILGLFNPAAVFRLRVDDKKCTSCGACRKTCKIGLEPHRQLRDPLCIRCMECTRCEAIGVESMFSGTKTPQDDDSNATLPP
jgi:polyferredoxin